MSCFGNLAPGAAEVQMPNESNSGVVMHPKSKHERSSALRVSALARASARIGLGLLRELHWHALPTHAVSRLSDGGNSAVISKPLASSVPMVSQTEIDPMKTALSLMLALVTTSALADPLPVPKPPGRAARASTVTSQAARTACPAKVLRMPSPSRRTAHARGDGSRAEATACAVTAVADGGNSRRAGGGSEAFLTLEQAKIDGL